VTSKPSPLLKNVEAELQRPTGSLRFAPDIEARFEAETGPARHRQIYIAGIVALLVFNAFPLNDYRVRPEVFVDLTP
jgi:hypothetical protein